MKSLFWVIVQWYEIIKDCLLEPRFTIFLKILLFIFWIIIGLPLFIGFNISWWIFFFLLRIIYFFETKVKIPNIIKKIKIKKIKIKKLFIKDEM